MSSFHRLSASFSPSTTAMTRPSLDGVRDFVDAVEDTGISATGSLQPASIFVPMFQPEARLAAGEIAHLAEAHVAVAVAVEMGRKRRARSIAAIAARSGPAAMIAAPARPIAFDGDAEALVFLMRELALGRALRAGRVVAAGAYVL